MDDITASWGDDGGRWSILVHGGAGDVPSHRLEAHVDGCRAAARAGAAVLRAGGRAIDAVQRAVEVLEDDPSFNAGTGACLTRDGSLELDAAIMDGGDRSAGAVCALPPFLHPIAVARAALGGPHVLYAGPGAARFAREKGFVDVAPEAMITEGARATRRASDRHGRSRALGGGTVGAVAHTDGHVAAATSTGGTSARLRAASATRRSWARHLCRRCGGAARTRGPARRSCALSGQERGRSAGERRVARARRRGGDPLARATGGRHGRYDPRRPRRPPGAGAQHAHDDLGRGERGLGTRRRSRRLVSRALSTSLGPSPRPCGPSRLADRNEGGWSASRGGSSSAWQATHVACACSRLHGWP